MEGLIGIAMPFLIDTINRDVTNSKLRFVISIIMCVAVGIALNAPKLRYESPKDVLESAALVIASSQITYKMFYENTKAQSIMRGGD